MTKTAAKISKKAGMPPGTLVHIGKKKSETTKLTVMDYDAMTLTETIFPNPEDCFQFKNTETVSWINIDGLHNTDFIASIGDHYELHHLLVEDILNTRHRPKVEEFENYIFLTLKMLGISKNGDSIISEQVSFVLGNNWVLSFQEQEGDIFDALRLRLRENKGTIREQGADYLLYRLVDTVVDNYFFVTEHLSESIDKLEEEVLKSPNTASLQQIQKMKRLVANMRKSTLPLREAIFSLEKDENTLIKATTRRYLRDVYEHIFHINDSFESQRDMLASIMDLYLSGISNKMNEVMKILTIIATIFIPLTFIAGLYGMNFDNMPELHWKFGYFIILGAMLIVFIIMLLYFKRKKWL